MAEYYPLISRAVASLRGGAPEARQAIYNRAKQALVGQLRGMQPPVPEEAINKEIAALDEAIARIEAEIVPPSPAPKPPERPEPPAQAASPAPPAIPVQGSAPPPSVAPPVGPTYDRPSSLATAAPAVAVPRPSAIRPPAPPIARTAAAPAQNERAAFERRSSLPVQRPLPPRSIRPTAPARAAVSEDVKPAPRSPSTTEAEKTSENPSTSRPQAAAADDVHTSADRPIAPLIEDLASSGSIPSASLPTAPTLEAADLGRPLDEAAGAAPVIRARKADGDDDESRPAPPLPDILAGEARGRDEVQRPAIPRQTQRAPRDVRVWIVAMAALAVLAAIALMAWKLRDNPEELARVPTPAQTEPATGKLAERADGPAEEPDAEVGAPSTPLAPVAPAAVPPAAVSQPAPEPAIAVAYKAAILVAAPDTPEKVKTYVGTVVWRSESVSDGQSQPLGTAVRADIDVPDAKFQAVMELRKNMEAQFPASHTIDLKFTVGPDSPVGNVKQIDVPRLRSEDAASGDPLVGVPVTITTNYFLVGLTRGVAEQRNLEALRTRGWIDIPMILENGTPAKITFEKGALGQQIIADALQAWSRS